MLQIQYSISRTNLSANTVAENGGGQEKEGGRGKREEKKKRKEMRQEEKEGRKCEREEKRERRETHTCKRRNETQINFKLKAASVADMTSVLIQSFPN